MNKTETLAYLSGDRKQDFSTLSAWVREQYDRYPNGFRYLESVADWIIRTNGLEVSPTERSNLVTLVYNAAGQAQRDAEIAEGWVDATPEYLTKVAIEGRKVDLKVSGLLCIEGVVTGRILGRENHFYLMKPRARTRGYLVGAGSKVRDHKPAEG